MNEQLLDKTGAPVTVTLDTAGPIGYYAVNLADETLAGQAQFVDTHDGPTAERIFFHTEVDQHYGGRGLGRLLVLEALADSMRHNLVVVPVCPLFASHLHEHGDDYIAAGGRFRLPLPADIALVQRAGRVG
ncbi:N-acetyltransferase [Rhodococcoides yunnanense]|uniref:N-acetyltransferase n=1 Tax=Rhodococcoides yunnanense TaxID=278209 RepID=UPI000933403E|nr:N-acetyltransferase [Rhodococcus yunnanensis]